jgi:2-dehydro-3-deoxyphosphogluconate aldolase/(4S)-4-hydroxy-2-oxoglutarate aldolase
MINLELAQTMERVGVVAVLTIADPADAVPVAQALHAGGVSAIELTFRTQSAAESIRRIRDGVPEAIVGAGTLLTAAQAVAAKNAGAMFGVSPGCSPATIRAAAEHGLPFAPGVMTPTDIETAVAHDCRVLKFFPAETSGGLAHLTTMAAPFAHLGLRFIPLGGINAGGLQRYLESPLILCVGGSWVASPELIQRKHWERIRENAAEAMRVVRTVRAGGASG